jgi:uncharacterized membrane protein YidH (DUF202 family)
MNELKELKEVSEPEDPKTKISHAKLNLDMAKQRAHLSYEINLMSWIRTALALVAFGMGIFEVADRTGGNKVFKSSKLIGILMIVLGMVSLIAAIYENNKNHTALLNNNIKYDKKTSLAFKIGIGLLIISGIAMLRIIIRLFHEG